MSDGDSEGAEAAGKDTGRRPRGRPRRLSLDRIASAAKKFPPETVTMQAVADELGVDPKALYYHVGDRDGLRDLVAMYVFETELSRVVLPLGSSWQVVMRCYARAMRDAVVKVGVQATSVRLSGVRGLGTLQPIERVLEALVGAGFDLDQARRALTLIADTAFAVGLSAVMLTQHATHPNVPGLIKALNAARDQDLPMLRQVVAGRDDNDQLDFQMDVILAGLEQLLQRGRLSP